MSQVDDYGWTDEERNAVLDSARGTSRPLRTCGGKSWKQVRLRIDNDEAFGIEYRAAREEFLDSLELVVGSAAADGYNETTTTTTSDGEKTVTEYHKVNTNLGLSMLAARRSDRWGKQDKVKHEITGKVSRLIIETEEGSE